MNLRDKYKEADQTAKDVRMTMKTYTVLVLTFAFLFSMTRVVSRLLPRATRLLFVLAAAVVAIRPASSQGLRRRK